MKKPLLVFFCYCVSLMASGQKIHFTDTSNKWMEFNVNTGGGAPVFSYYTYSFIQDTLMDGFQYKWFSIETDYCSPCGSFIREDTVLKKVYIKEQYHDGSLDTDVVLMDYNLNVGDTFTIVFYFSDVKRYKVTGIDSTQINAIWHRVWHFSRDMGSMYSPWCDVIEGIGCIQHPAYMLRGIGVPGEYQDNMYCFSNNGTTPVVSPAVSFFDNTTSCAYYPTLGTLSVNNTPVKNSVKISPNPTYGELTIRSSDPIHQVSITNLLGITVCDGVYDKPEVQINISDLPAGIYFARINGVEVRKFVKQ